MEKYYVSFTTRDCDFPGGKAYHKKYSEYGQIIKNEKCKRLGIKTISWNPDKLKETEFYEKNKNIFSQRRGYGYWLWKPYIVEKALEQANEGDFIYYMDAGSSYPFPNLFEKYSKMCNKEGMFFVNSRHQNKHFIKRDAYYYMDFDNEKIYNSLQINACFIIFKKNDFTLNFVKEWKGFCEDERILSDNPNVCGLENLPEFEDHRHDQAILTILAAKKELATSGLYLDEIK